MNKLLSVIGIVAVVGLVGVGLFIKQSNGGSPKTENTVSVPLPTKEPTQVPSDVTGITGLSQVELFLKAISEGKPSEAVMMMTAETTGNETNKQATAVQYAIFKKFTVSKIEPIMKDTWTDTIEEYKITIDAEIKPGAASGAPIPNYGWDNGSNIRFITVERIGADWKIQGIATGP